MPTLEPHQERVVLQKRDLDEKLAELVPFMLTDTYQALDPAERDRLRLQSIFMIGYAATLDARIKAFTT